MKSEHFLMIIFGIMAIGAAIYFIRGVKVDVAHHFTNEEQLHITFNPEQKWTWPDHKGIYIKAGSEPYQRLYDFLINYGRVWFKEDDIPANPLIRIQGDKLRMDIFKYHFYLSGENNKGYYRTYRGRDEEGVLMYLLELMPENK